MTEKISIDFKMTEENKKILDELTKPIGVRHFLIETEFGDKFDVVGYPEYQKLEKVIGKAIEHLDLFISDTNLNKYDTLKILMRTKMILKEVDKEVE